MPWQEPPQQKAYACNGELVAFLRQKRGWTQRELAQESGYSERLVSKAEASQSISASTVADLADTLATPREPVHPEDLICDPVTLAKAYIAAEYEHPGNNVEKIRHFLDEDLVTRLNGDPEVIPFAGEHYGIDGLERAYSIFFSIIEPPANHDWRPWYKFACHGNEVIVWGQNWMGPIGQPLTQPMQLVHRFVFQRGKLVLSEVLFDAAQGAEYLRQAGLLDEAGKLLSNQNQ
ncbi:transcriptional regulator [Aeoliella sp. ICT_H6.2]|uniref:Transcriptional regulator n=1 Tax=Aeoliella straminimaris TaxID=2954799 RepID=A0A9X2F5U7_9BACT|nr:helix-turn-helix domain-containing protein [Aeoliella straminimaris]MCO6042324.1 transcriptional regulator [Aeoliella straminimaris]